MDLLTGLRVVSFNHFLAGPTAAQIFGDLGADVIAVEPTEGAFQRNWAVANHFVSGQSVIERGMMDNHRRSASCPSHSARRNERTQLFFKQILN